jgi:hypothetical protein
MVAQQRRAVQLLVSRSPAHADVDDEVKVK